MEFYISKNNEASSTIAQISKQWGIQEIICIQSLSILEIVKEHKLQNLALIKMDVEGSEIQILNSFSNEFITSVPQITVEFHDFLDVSLFEPTKSIIQKFNALGFLVIVASRNSFSHTLFINKKIIPTNLSFKMGYLLH